MSNTWRLEVAEVVQDVGVLLEDFIVVIPAGLWRDGGIGQSMPGDHLAAGLLQAIQSWVYGAHLRAEHVGGLHQKRRELVGR